jgi:hypothetical protein
MKITIHCSPFDSIQVEGIDMSTISYYGSTEDYGHNHPKSFNTIGFSLEDTTKTQEVCEYIKSKFKLNKDVCKIEDYIWIRDKFEDYVEDKRPRIAIKFPNGCKGMVNPPVIEFSK